MMRPDIDRRATRRRKRHPGPTAVAVLLACYLAGLGPAAAAPAAEAASVQLLAAGSLRYVLTRAAEAFARATGVRVEATFGPSGLLRERIERERVGDVFASASLRHAETLWHAGHSAPPVVFAHNEMVLVLPPGNPTGITAENWIDRLADPGVRVGTSTPGADPSGDYAWELFRRIDRDRPGFFATMDRKALKLVGASLTAPADGRSPYAAIIDERRADVLVVYRTSAAALRDREKRPVTLLALPERYAVRTDYAVGLLAHAKHPRAADFVFFLLSPTGQRILADEGFVPVALPLAAE